MGVPPRGGPRKFGLRINEMLDEVKKELVSPGISMTSEIPARRGEDTPIQDKPFGAGGHVWAHFFPHYYAPYGGPPPGGTRKIWSAY